MTCSLYPMIIHRTQEMFNLPHGSRQNVTNLFEAYHINDIADLMIVNEFFIYSATKQVQRSVILSEGELPFPIT